MVYKIRGNSSPSGTTNNGIGNGGRPIWTIVFKVVVMSFKSLTQSGNRPLYSSMCI